MTKELKNKAIKLKGKDYVQVKDRVLYFNDTYPQGMIVTELLSDPVSDVVTVMATIYPDVQNEPDRCYTGLSRSTYGDAGADENAALENAETSAVGRALAFMGIGVIDSVASMDEMRKAGVKDVQENAVDNGATCEKCGAPMKLSQAGKLYCSKLCWKN